MWQDWASAILGLCVIFAVVLGLQGMALTWTMAILGAAIAILGFWEAAILRNDRS